MVEPARRYFRILTRVRGGYNGGTMFDVQLQSSGSGSLLWAQTFTDEREANEYEFRVTQDLDELTDVAFRRKYGVPLSA